jgi:hypothetical protein
MRWKRRLRQICHCQEPRKNAGAKMSVDGPDGVESTVDPLHDKALAIAQYWSSNQDLGGVGGFRENFLSERMKEISRLAGGQPQNVDQVFATFREQVITFLVIVHGTSDSSRLTLAVRRCATRASNLKTRRYRAVACTSLVGPFHKSLLGTGSARTLVTPNRDCHRCAIAIGPNR